jgi:hypothetical protein
MSNRYRGPSKDASYQVSVHLARFVEIFWDEIYRGQLFLGSNLVSFNRTLIVPYEISKVNFHAEFFFLISMSEEI